VLYLPIAVLVKLLHSVTLTVALSLLPIYKVQPSSLNLPINKGTNSTGEKLLSLGMALWLSYRTVNAL
jgi:hypothetical protein